MGYCLMISPEGEEKSIFKAVYRNITQETYPYHPTIPGCGPISKPTIIQKLATLLLQMVKFLFEVCFIEDFHFVWLKEETSCHE